MKLPDGRERSLNAGVLVEPTPGERRLVLWLPAGSDGKIRYWERVSTTAGAPVTVAEGLCFMEAAALPLRERRRGWLARLFGRQEQAVRGLSWAVPNGSTAEPRGERQTDLVLVWAEMDDAPLDEPRVRGRWPAAQRVQQLGPGLFLVYEATGVSEAARAEEEMPRAVAERRVEVARKARDRRLLAAALSDLGAAHLREGNIPQASTALNEAAAVAHPIGDHAAECDALDIMGQAARLAGETTLALNLFEQELGRALAVADGFAQKRALGWLGRLRAGLGEHKGAVAIFEEALTLARALGDVDQEVDLVWQLAIEHAAQDQLDLAGARAAEAVSLLRQMGRPEAGVLADAVRRCLDGESPAARATPVEPPRVFDGPIVVGFGSEASGAEIVQPEHGAAGLRAAWAAAHAPAQPGGNGWQAAAPEVVEARLRVCRGCVYHTGLRCRVDGKFTALKARSALADCPLRKWPRERQGS